ncbi:MAG TPA: heme NO-binding domain-containing protein [Nevskiaceae bacterium]|nr:heme NO-binding domain-containing protein [Nevskiaceae bacterium]
MRGVIFTELMDMVEARMGLAMKDRVLTRAAFAHGGAYTNVGNYPSQELDRLVTLLAEESGLPRAALLEAYGEYLLEYFVREYEAFFEVAGSALAFLARIESYIHLEVRKLYPQAELPHFDYPVVEPHRLVMEYRSPRGLADVALGLIKATLRHYGEPLRLEVERLDGEAGRHARFTLTQDRGPPAP